MVQNFKPRRSTMMSIDFQRILATTRGPFMISMLQKATSVNSQHNKGK